MTGKCAGEGARRCSRSISPTIDARSRSSMHDCRLFTAGMPAATRAYNAFLLSVAGVGPRGWLRMTKKSGLTVTVSGFFLPPLSRIGAIVQRQPEGYRLTEMSFQLH